VNWLNANKQHAWMMIPLLAFLEACPGIGLLVSGVVLLTVSTILYTEQLATLAQIVIGFCRCLSVRSLGFLSRSLAR